MKFYTVYKTVNKENGKYYIGKHISDNPYDGYLGSGKILKRAIKKYGLKSFQKTVLFIFDNKKDMNDKELELVNEKDDLSYNLKRGGQGGFDHIHSSKELCSKIGRMGYDAGLAKLSKEKRQKIAKQNYKNSLEKYIKSNDPEIKKKRSENAKKAFKGGHHTEESKKLISEKQKLFYKNGGLNPNYGKCWIYSNTEKKCITITKTNLQFWLDKGWIKGRKIIFKS